MENQLLSIITFLPLVAAAILALFMRGDDAAARKGAKGKIRPFRCERQTWRDRRLRLLDASPQDR